MHREDLQFLVRTAIAARHSVELHRLLGRHGTVAFAEALSPWSVRAVDDGLALLAPAARARVFQHLSPATRDRLRAQPRPVQPRRMQADAVRTPVRPADGARAGWLIHRFAGLLDGWSGWPGLGTGRTGLAGATPRAAGHTVDRRAIRPSVRRDAGASASRAVAMTWAADL